MTPAPAIKKTTLNDIHAQWTRTQDPRYMNQMLDVLSPDLDKAVYAYSGMNAGPAVRSKAKLLAVKAIKNYSPDSGSALRTWVYTQLQPISRYARDIMPSPMPERAYQQLSALRRQEADFYENKGRPPSELELADLTGMSVRQLGKIRSLDKRTFSESAIVAGGDAPASSQEMTAVRNLGFSKDVLDTMYPSLSPTEQVILDHRLGYNGKPLLSNTQVAAKLKISPGRVSQLTTGLAAKLDEYAAINRSMQ